MPTAIDISDAVVTINDTRFYAKPCTIESTMLGVEDHGIMTAYIFVNGAGWGVGLGGYALDCYDPDEKRRVGNAVAGVFIDAVLKCVGVESWEALKGRQVHALFDSGNSLGSTGKGIASADLSRALVFADLFTKAVD